jgi:hypothetical protein
VTGVPPQWWLGALLRASIIDAEIVSRLWVTNNTWQVRSEVFRMVRDDPGSTRTKS